MSDNADHDVIGDAVQCDFCGKWSNEQKRIEELEAWQKEARELLSIPYRGIGKNHKIKMDEWLTRRDALLGERE